MLKRLFDILFSAIGLIILSPLMLIAALLLIANLGYPIFFSQVRPGFKATPFKIYKFRTMKSLLNENGEQLADSERLTRVGLLLRSTSIDELPELWNVLIGDMSLVGPRPLLVEYLPLYSKGQARRHEVRPGITGWAQVNGRNALSWSDRFKLDVWYVDNQSFLLDLKILLMTVKKVWIREGISEKGQATMTKFTGNAK